MHDTSSQYKLGNRTLLEWCTSWPSVVIFVLVIILSTGASIHSQLSKLGESTWDNYFSLRAAIGAPTPSCDRDVSLQSEVDRLLAKRSAKKQKLIDSGSAIMASLVVVDKGAITKSIKARQTQCHEDWNKYQAAQDRVTPELKAYVHFEAGVGWLARTLGQYKKLLLLVLVMVCSAAAAFTRHHISLRSIRTRKEFYVSTWSQLIANGLLTISSGAYWLNDIQSVQNGVAVNSMYLHYFWVIGFGVLTLISLAQLITKPKGLEEGGTYAGALLAIPLYCFMCFSASAMFFTNNYVEGTAVYLTKLMSHSGLFLQLALYGWIGMMLTQTRMMHLLFDVLRPWKMSPELLSLIVLLIVAVPTAYTGASGIFVLAAGAVIYNELRRGGARRQLALGATAMSGSMGVVLAPCLLMVIIAALDGDVTTTQLFHSGFKLFIMTAIIYFIVSQLFRKDPITIAPVREALPESIKRLKPLVPYVLVFVVVMVIYWLTLGMRLDRFSAPYILPVIMLALLFYENVIHKSTKEELEEEEAANLINEQGKSFEQTVRFATNQTCGPIGALLILMALSVSSSGIIERMDLVAYLPDQFGSVWVAMTVVMLAMVLVGMFMDPYGAVIVVNATIAQVAKANGLDPLHFWMMSLMCFELGYLMPPIGLNHLLARQVIGADEVAKAKITVGSFWRRYEKWLMPICVLLPSLLLVTYLPLMSDTLHHWLFPHIGHP